MLALERLVKKEMAFCTLERKILTAFMEKMKKVYDSRSEIIINRKETEKENPSNQRIKNLAIKKENDPFKLSLH